MTEQPIKLESQLRSNALIPGARDGRAPIIPNITKHERNNSYTRAALMQEQSLQGNNMSVGLDSGRAYLH